MPDRTVSLRTTDAGRASRDHDPSRCVFHGAFNALTDRAAILDEHGTIIETNAAWNRSAAGKGALSARVGDTYLEACEGCVGAGREDAERMAAGIRGVLSGSRDYDEFQYEVRSAPDHRSFVGRVSAFSVGGSRRVLLIYAAVTARARPSQADGAMEEVSIEKATEDALQATATRYLQVLENAWEGIATVNGSGAIEYANPRLASMLGVSQVELWGKPLFDFVRADLQVHSRNTFARRFRGIGEAEELSYVRADGSEIHVIQSMSSVLHPDGTFAEAIVMISDITERKVAETVTESVLRAADLDRRRLSAMLDAIPVGVWISDTTGKLSHANPAAAKIWGGDAPTAEDTSGYAVYRAWWPSTGKMVEPHEWALPRVLESGAAVTNELVEIERFDGSRGFVLNSAAPVVDSNGVITGGIVVNVDVTERQAQADRLQRLAAELRAQHGRLRAVFDLAPSFLAVYKGTDFVVEEVNTAFVKLMGGRDVIGRRLLDVFPEFRAQGFGEILTSVLVTGKPFVAHHLRSEIGGAEGSEKRIHYVDIAIQRIANAEGDHSVVVHGVDVSDEVRTSEALRQNEQRLRDLFAKLPVAAMLWESRGGSFHLLEQNDAAKALGAAVPSLFDAGIHVGQELWNDLHQALSDGLVSRRTVSWSGGTGSDRRILDLTVAPQPPDRVLMQVVDVTERRALEAQLQQAQKMEAVGQLAGGVAHDFNNLLTVIAGHGDFLREAVGQDPQHRDDIDAIRRATRRAADLTRQLLAFSRKQLLKPMVFDVNDLLVEMSKMLSRLLGEEIGISVQPDAGASLVLADPGQIEQVIMNLSVNARDAMPQGGRLRLSTSNVCLTESVESATDHVPPGEYVRISVADTGVGMDRATQRRLFEPFFTTKLPGKGTGLGLATVYGIVKQSGGHIVVSSEVGVGSTFDVYLPRTADSDRLVASLASDRGPMGGTETILLVEDEPTLRSVARRTLVQLGYTVLEASNGPEALELSQECLQDIHLVLSDAVMPGMTGAETVRRLQEKRPDLRAIFMSGYTDDEVLRRGIVSSNVPFLQKPFEREDLARIVRQVLDVTSA